MSTSIGILLVNLGSPDAATPDAVKRYLKEFLSDRRVVNLPAILWQPILRGIILRTRPAKVALKYQTIWQGEHHADGAPLKRITAEQAARLAAEMPHKVYWAMRYQNPSIESVIEQMHRDGIRHFVLLPMYPQYSTTTTLSVVDEVERSLKAYSGQNIKLTTITDYHAHPSYVKALAESVRSHWAKVGVPNWLAGDKLMVSFHGIPKVLVDKGDPYQRQCQATFDALIAELGIDQQQAHIVYQSRFGAQKWLEPYASPTLKALAQAGTKRIDILCPGFAADCLETLEEVQHELAEEFMSEGGQTYHYIPCLNEHTKHLEQVLTSVIDGVIGT
jgi:ferrochelatase